MKIQMEMQKLTIIQIQIAILLLAISSLVDSYRYSKMKVRLTNIEKIQENYKCK